MEKLTPESAIVTIDNALAQINTTRENHDRLQECVALLHGTIQDWRKLLKDIKKK